MPTPPFPLSGAQVRRLSPHVPLSRGVPRMEDRGVISGTAYVIREDLQWRDTPSLPRMSGPDIPPSARFRARRYAAPYGATSLTGSPPMQIGGTAGRPAPSPDQLPGLGSRPDPIQPSRVQAAGEFPLDLVWDTRSGALSSCTIDHAEVRHLSRRLRSASHHVSAWRPSRRGIVDSARGCRSSCLSRAGRGGRT